MFTLCEEISTREMTPYANNSLSILLKFSTVEVGNKIYELILKSWRKWVYPGYKSIINH
jgi:hypothetical protein